MLFFNAVLQKHKSHKELYTTLLHSTSVPNDVSHSFEIMANNPEERILSSSSVLLFFVVLSQFNFQWTAQIMSEVHRNGATVCTKDRQIIRYVIQCSPQTKHLKQPTVG